MKGRKLDKNKGIDSIIISIYNLAKGCVPAGVMALLFKSQLGVMNLGQQLICIFVLFCGICVEYLNKMVDGTVK